MLRKMLIGLVAMLLFLGPGAGVVALAAVVDPVMVNAATCTTDSSGRVSGPSLPVTGTIPSSLTAATTDGQTITLNHTQLVRAAEILATGNSENIPGNGQVIALMAALTESGLRVLANTSAYPESADYPHDGNGSDRDSLGLFQMRPSTGWGSVAHVMDPVWSSRAFYGGPGSPNHGSPRGLLDIPHWQTLSLGQAAQAVEGSAFPDRYSTYQPAAEKIASILTGVTLTPGNAQCRGGGGSGNLPAGFASRFIRAAEKETGVPYVWAGGTYTGPSGIGPDGRGPGFDCSGLVMYAAYQASGGKIRLQHWTGDQIHAGTTVTWAGKKPGDIILYTYPGDTEPHHVVIYLGGNRIFHAPAPGQNVGYGLLSYFPGQIATVRRLA